MFIKKCTTICKLDSWFTNESDALFWFSEFVDGLKGVGVSVLFLRKTNWEKECVCLNLNSHNKKKQCDVIEIMVTEQLILLVCYIMYIFSSSEKWIIVMFLIYIFVFYSQMYWWWVDNPLETFTINNKSLWKIPKSLHSI